MRTYTTSLVCQAKQRSDQMCCSRCDIAWDIGDCDPPECHILVDPSRYRELKRKIACWTLVGGLSLLVNFVGLTLLAVYYLETQ